MSQTPPPHARPLFHIRYREDFGNVVRRDIFPIRPYATTEGVRAWCYLMGEMRLFKFDQIEAVKEINTGRDIKARGLWEWCGLPTTDMAFSDELPGALKQSRQTVPDSECSSSAGERPARWMLRPAGGKVIAQHSVGWHGPRSPASRLSGRPFFR